MTFWVFGPRRIAVRSNTFYDITPARLVSVRTDGVEFAVDSLTTSQQVAIRDRMNPPAEGGRAELEAAAAAAEALTTWSKPTDLARPANFVSLSLLNLVQLNSALGGQTTTDQALVDRVNALSAQVAAQSAAIDALGAALAKAIDYLLGE